MARDFKKELDERLKGWKRKQNGDIAYLDYNDCATFPMAGGLLAVALRFHMPKTDRTAARLEVLQLGLSPQQCRHLAAALLDGAGWVEKDAKVPEQKN